MCASTVESVRVGELITHARTLAAACCYSYPLTTSEELVGLDRPVHLELEDGEEALAADGLTGLGAA